ncbi:MAG: 23S rRNA (adenine(2503)-C(2))-methyltransferase RlmN, partial [Rhodocyclaceae bacterium]|nr:23S rRNA (adenine(2503)-C(2))-methyltransferase RlmN [Rhodocyclaceae bacterium]
MQRISRMEERINLLDFSPAALTAWLVEQGEKPFRARQVLRWVHRAGCDDFAQMTDVAKALRARLQATAQVRAPAVRTATHSADGTRKWLLDVGQGNAVEMVFIP